MKKYILILLAAALGLAACENEKDLKPTGADTDWSKDLDLSNPVVKLYFEECGVGILTDFDANRDIVYNVNSRWDGLSLEKFEDADETERAFRFLEESFLVYFTDKEFIKKYFPRKILLSKEVFLQGSASNLYCPVTEESDARVGGNAINSLHSIYNEGAFAFSAKLETIYYNETNYNNYKYDNLYIFIANLFERNGFYNEFGSDLYLPSMANYYGRRMTGQASAGTNNKPGVWIEEGMTPEDATHADKYWYWNKGFVSTAVLNPVITSGGNAGKIEMKAPSGLIHSFPQKEREVRMLINQMLLVTEEVWDSYPDIIKDRFAVLVAKFDEWGIDIRSINPAMEHAFPR